MDISAHVRKHALSIPGKQQLVMTAFAKALEIIPRQICDNAGLDSSDLVARLRKAIYDGMSTYGLDLSSPGGGIADMRDVGGRPFGIAGKPPIAPAGGCGDAPLEFR